MKKKSKKKVKKPCKHKNMQFFDSCGCCGHFEEHCPDCDKYFCSNN